VNPKADTRRPWAGSACRGSRLFSSADARKSPDFDTDRKKVPGSIVTAPRIPTSAPEQDPKHRYRVWYDRTIDAFNEGAP
jgi:hypothetical protein